MSRLTSSVSCNVIAISALSKSAFNREEGTVPALLLPLPEVGLARLRHQKCAGPAGPTCVGEGRDEGASPRARNSLLPPSPQPSPRKRGEGAQTACSPHTPFSSRRLSFCRP